MNMRPKVGDRVLVYNIPGVSWPGQERGEGVVGTVTRLDASDAETWVFVPDMPDPTTNGGGNGQGGWWMGVTEQYEPFQYVIEEEVSLNEYSEA